MSKLKGHGCAVQERGNGKKKTVGYWKRKGLDARKQILTETLN